MSIMSVVESQPSVWGLKDGAIAETGRGLGRGREVGRHQRTGTASCTIHVKSLQWEFMVKPWLNSAY